MCVENGPRVSPLALGVETYRRIMHCKKCIYSSTIIISKFNESVFLFNVSVFDAVVKNY